MMYIVFSKVSKYDAKISYLNNTKQYLQDLANLLFPYVDDRR